MAADLVADLAAHGDGAEESDGVVHGDTQSLEPQFMADAVSDAVASDTTALVAGATEKFNEYKYKGLAM